MDLHIQRNMGARSIQTELMRLRDVFSLATIHKILIIHHAKLLKS